MITFGADAYVHNTGQTKRLMGGGGTPSGPLNITLQLDPYTTRMLLEGRPANTSTRAALGK